jgi:hypothetical protein
MCKGYCRIGEGTMPFFPNGSKNSGGCGECVTATDVGRWTVKSGCLIEDRCYKAGALDATRCGKCDPSSSAYWWTPAAGGCLVQGTCYGQGKLHATGCLECDTAKGKQRLVVPSSLSTSAVHEGFESGAAIGWTLVSADPKTTWSVVKTRAASGSYSLYFGDPASNTIAGSDPQTSTASMPSVTLGARGKAALSFLVYMDLEASDTFDRLWVEVNGTKVWSRGKNSPHKTWTNVVLDLSSYAGTSVGVSFHFDSVDHNANGGQGIFIDEVTVVHGC